MRSSLITRRIVLSLFVVVGAAAPAGSIAASDLSFLSSAASADPNIAAVPSLDGDPNEILRQIVSKYQQAIHSTLLTGDGCSASTITVRKEWNSLSPSEKQSFYDAMNCMNRLPARTSTTLVPGARTRYDDWTAAHIMATPRVHFSPWLLLWHRYFIWTFEKAMQDECGYPGGLPYGDWTRFAPTAPGILSDLGGDGTQVPGSTCSCVRSGPFATWQVTLGPTGTGDACSPNPQEDGLGHNPRCLERHFDYSLLSNLSVENVAATIGDSPDIDTFVTRLDVGPALHATPHSFIGGLNGGIPASSHDPWFFTHHACLDRLYSMWVGQDANDRTGAIAKASTYTSLRRAGWGDAPNVTLDSTLSISPVFNDIRARDVISTTGGPFCYMYE